MPSQPIGWMKYVKALSLLGDCNGTAMNHAKNNKEME